MAQQANPSPQIGANNAAMYSNAAAVNGNIMPSAGHYADMQTLMQSMETLSGWLQQNREDWAGLQDGLAQVERVGERLGASGHAEGNGMVNGDSGEPSQPPPPDDNTRPTLLQLQTALSASHARISALESQLRSHETLQALYESHLTETTSRIRQYCYEQTTHTLALHRHYTALLSQSREELVEAQITHQGWQEGLQRLSESVRLAYGERERERQPWVRRWRGLREENRVLRRMVGWEDVADGDGEEEEEGEWLRALEVGRGFSRGSLSGGGGGEGGGVA